LISPCHPSKILIVLAISCLAWIGAISFAVVYFLGTAVSTGWIIGGILFVALAVWVVVMLREIRNAIELPNSLSNSDGTIDAADKSALAHPRSGIMDSRKKTPVRGHKSRPRKLRSSGAELPSLIGH
jgi:hypothetical protein